MQALLIQTTTSTKKEAKSIAKLLLEKKLCACIQISKIESLYPWDGEICEDKEYLLNIKTKSEHFEKIKREIKENHSYDLPEIIGIPIEKISKEYKNFIKDTTQ